MAQQQQQDRDYRKTEVYKKADATKRRDMERYKASLKITDDHMFLLLALQDLRDLPKEDKRKGNSPAEMMVCGSIILFLAVTTSQQSHAMMLLASILVFISAGFYFTGILNPYSNALRCVKKQLKTCPQVQSFADWQAANGTPAQSDESAQKDK